MKQDGRRSRGESTRQAVARRAAELATIHGLSGLTIGQLAEDMGLGKSSVAAAYGTKQDLQLAAIDSARATFIDRIIRPALDQPPGLPRLIAMIDTWLAYVELPVFPGGCFLVATAAEFDSRPGPVRDRLRELRGEWLAQLTAQVEKAQADGSATGMPAALVAFEIDAVLAAANIARNMRDGSDALAMAREIVRVRLEGDRNSPSPGGLRSGPPGSDPLYRLSGRGHRRRLGRRAGGWGAPISVPRRIVTRTGTSTRARARRYPPKAAAAATVAGSSITPPGGNGSRA